MRLLENEVFRELFGSAKRQSKSFSCHPHLQIHVSQLVFLDQVIDASHL